LLGSQSSEDETASLSPSADGNTPFYDCIRSSDNDCEVADNLSEDSAGEAAPDLGEDLAALAATTNCTK